MSKPVILTGLRANNDLHIGNYFGGLLPIVDMAKNKSDNYQVNLFMPDLHSFTTPIDHSKLKQQIKGSLKSFIAAGLPIDYENVHIYRQSFVPAHSELTIILNSFTGFGEMSRMTQFKDKSATIGDERVSVGLFDYPVLMAADILLYGAEYIPVGDDQTQHLEFTRDIAERMNKRFNKKLFTVPKPVNEQHKFFGKDQGLRIKDLQDPVKKMSKSNDSDKGVIFINDSPQTAHSKVMSAATDNVGVVNDDPKNQPGIANLLQIYKLLSIRSGKTADDSMKSVLQMSSYSDFKKIVADEVAEFLEDFQSELDKVDESAIEDKLKSSEETMNRQANETLENVQKTLGLR